MRMTNIKGKPRCELLWEHTVRQLNPFQLQRFACWDIIEQTYDCKVIRQAGCIRAPAPRVTYSGNQTGTFTSPYFFFTQQSIRYDGQYQIEQ